MSKKNKIKKLTDEQYNEYITALKAGAAVGMAEKDRADEAAETKKREHGES